MRPSSLHQLYYLIPLYVMIITSLKDLDAIRYGNIFIPTSNPTFAPWVKAWSEACTGLKCSGLAPGFLNSVQYHGSQRHRVDRRGCGLRIFTGELAVQVRRILFHGACWLGSFMPYQVMLYPLVIITREMGIYSTLWAVIFIHTVFGLPILTLLFRNYFASLPPELFKAARVDGAGYWRIFFQVMMPMSVPIFTVAVILQVTGIWNDFLFGVIYAGPTNYPMTVQLNNIVNSLQGVKEYNVDMAATILTGLVPLTIYFVSGKYFVRGIAAGAVKG